ncbi:hypothetical protein BCR43DRAFT_460590 [Syncephalastrum racemosum]|uniref:sn-1-specific diacylglycerol lipase n=1 Tax=Syncephalastrum racemosum TaxID=13706 RepID=A0A1X2H882_SYNRA|nr:hypothetical protein BCR43DRAFT_460590 [Syncephalastrum racemosum]
MANDGMAVSSSDLVPYAGGNLVYASSTLLPTNIANLITAVSLAARLSLRCSSLFMEILFETAKYSTVFSFGLSRQALVNAISTAKRLHAITYSDQPSQDIPAERSGFLQVLDKYTNLGIYVIHHTFTLAELFALSGLHFTSQTIQTGIKAAEESVGIIDGIFGSNETSRAIASIVSLVHQELMQDPDFVLAQGGKMAILSGLTKAMTTFAVLQNVTHKRTMESFKVTLLWKGLVVEEEQNEQQMLQYNNDHDAQGEHAPDVIQELEEILATDERDEDTGLYGTSAVSLQTLQREEQPNGTVWRYPMYEVTTTTRRTTTRTTRIRPIDPTQDEFHQPRTKYVVVKSDEEDAESFLAVIDQEEEEQDNLKSLPGAWKEHAIESTDLVPASASASRRAPSRGLKVMLSAVSKKFARKKVERQVKYEHEDHSDGDSLGTRSEDEYYKDAGPITTMTSTSTTLRSASTKLNPAPSGPSTSPTKPLPPPPPTPSAHVPTREDDESVEKNSEQTIKRKSSWGRLKIKGAQRRKSVSSLFQKGAEVLNNQKASRKGKQPAPPMPALPSERHSKNEPLERRGRSNSITSLSSTVSRTLTTYTTAPSSVISQENSTRRQRRAPSLPPSHRRRRPQPLDSEPDPRNFPRQHIIHNIAHFMRYASAAYGESFMRILGIGDIPSVLPNSHHPNHHAFAHHTGVSVSDILLSSWTDTSPLTAVQHPQLHALVHYVTVDHSAKAVVLTCRGTLGLSDVLTDLTCDYAEFEHEGNEFVAHAGMLEAAQLLAKQKGKVYQVILEGLVNHPDYGLVLCGHSLGAGVVSLLSVLWSQERTKVQEEHPIAAAALARDPIPFITSRESGLPPGRPIHCYTYGPPCVMSHDLSTYCSGLITSVVHGYDIVSCLSLGLLKDFKNVAVSLHTEGSVVEEILGRVVGRYRRAKEKVDQSKQQHEGEDDDDEQWFWALIKTMRADMRADKLYPPSTVYLVESVPQLVQQASTKRRSAQGQKSQAQHRRAYAVALSRCDDIQARFSEIMFSRTMFMDHSPNFYEKAIRHLHRGYFGQ